MSVTEGQPIVPASMIGRIKALILKPGPTFDVIAGEAATVPGLYRGWIAPLGLISPVCFAVGSVLFLGVPVVSALMSGAAFYLGWLIGPMIASIIIANVAPRFGGEADRVQALKLAAYGMTPSMLSGVFSLVPMLAFLAVVGFYSVYLLWVGLPKVMRVPQDKALACFAVILVILLVIGMIIAGVTSTLLVTRFD